MTEHWMELYLVLGVAIPLASFTFLVFFGYRLGKPLAGWVATAAIAASCLLSTVVMVSWLGLTPDDRVAKGLEAARYTWSYLGQVPIDVGVKLDSLTVIMFFMVTFIATWIHVFSIGYMAGHSDEVDGNSKFHRFFTYLSLFCFSMLGLVISSSLLFLFIFWELVGLCSYLLIGFYFDRKYASDAAIKAFVTNRVGDFGFLLGLMMVFFYLHTLDLDAAAATFGEMYRSGTGIFSSSIDLWGWTISGAGLATLMGIGLFCGAMGKSAQFPLHVWLPDAMAGPTPVSALIHAATMVAAGVYLVARIFRLLTPDAQMFIAIIGCITLTLTALIAIVQTDIKKVLAYSTLSQLGYMIFGMGTGAWIAALFHLMTHAFFKAMLFLGSGQVIEGCHHEQDIRKMGGLRTKMPVTCWTFFLGVLAIAGFGIPGTPFGLGGFFSKDEILVAAYHRAYEWDKPVEHHAAQSPPLLRGGSGGSERRGLSATGPFMYSDLPQSLLIKEGNLGFPPFQGGIEGGQNGDHFNHTDLPQLLLIKEGSMLGLGMEGIMHVRLASDTTESHTAKSDHASGGHVDQHELQHTAALMPKLPKWLFWLPIIIAYVTPFYMMRCWWLTFMGKPRDHHVHDHAHESPMMYIPLVVLGLGTVVSSYWLFRDLIADSAVAATNAPMVVGIDGHAHDASHAAGLYIGHSAHHAMIPIVGGAFVVGFAIAIAIYWNGFGVAERIARWPGVNLIYVALREKLFFDHLYNAVFVNGTKIVLAQTARFVDTYVIDLLANLSARITERFSVFTGRVLDAHGVDGIVNGAAESAWDLGRAMGRPQTGRIRNYVLFAAAGAAILIAIVLFGDRIWGLGEAVASIASPPEK